MSTPTPNYGSIYLYAVFLPDKSIRSNAVYYSCAGVDLDAPITTVATPDGGFIPFDLQAIAKIIDLKYDDQSKSIVFGVDHYNPEVRRVMM